MLRFACVLLLVMEAVSGGAGADSVETRPIRLPSGAILNVPQTAAIDWMVDALHVYPFGRDVRSRQTITVSFDGVQQHDPTLERLRVLDGVEIRYLVQRLNGGSGGTESLFAAERALCGGMLRVEQWAQQEYGTPHFALPWAILETAGC